jgi:hypothetical protein
MRVFSLLAIIILFQSGGPHLGYEPRSGDVVFHTSRSTESMAIQKATNSPYSHMGIVYVRDGKPLVFEAVEPVKRLADADRLLTPEALSRMVEVAKPFEGKHYDPCFEWSDERMYCSELVWKIFKRVLGIEVGELQTISELDLSDPVVQAKVRERWQEGPPPDQRVISPGEMFASKRLVTVYEN